MGLLAAVWDLLHEFAVINYELVASEKSYLLRQIQQIPNYSSPTETSFAPQQGMGYKVVSVRAPPDFRPAMVFVIHGSKNKSKKVSSASM
jgi:hypothetical protein